MVDEHGEGVRDLLKRVARFAEPQTFALRVDLQQASTSVAQVHDSKLRVSFEPRREPVADAGAVDRVAVVASRAVRFRGT